MAKSIRSKHKRKMRAIKRKKSEVKELAKLKQVLGLDNQMISDDMKDLVTGNKVLY